MIKARLYSLVLLSLLSISAGSATAGGQTTQLPSAPTAKPTQPALSLQPTNPQVITESKGAAPPAGAEEEDDCYAPAEGLYAPQPKDPPKLAEAVALYEFRMSSRVNTFWKEHMPWAANDAWIKGKLVLVRFAIMPDGSIDTPIVTLTSGRKDYDKHALDAVLKSAPFAPLPAGEVHPVPVCLRFGYNVDPRPKEDAKPDPLFPEPRRKP
jgi:TonB family protein